MLVATVGDLLLDVIVRLDGPLEEETDAYGRTSAGAGGQAANVAAWVSALGGRSRFVGKRASDAAGRVVADELRRRGVELLGPVVPEGTGTVVSIARLDGTRAMLTDRGVAVELRHDEVDPEWAGEADWLHVPGYSLVSSPIAEAAAALSSAAARTSVDVSSVTAVRTLGADEFHARLQAIAPAVVFATEPELELLGSVEVETLVVKRGARGCLVRRGAVDEEHPARPAEVVDGTGAGDAFAAGFLLGGVELAATAAARCVSQVGALP